MGKLTGPREICDVSFTINLWTNTFRRFELDVLSALTILLGSLLSDRENIWPMCKKLAPFITKDYFCDTVSSGVSWERLDLSLSRGHIIHVAAYCCYVH